MTVSLVCEDESLRRNSARSNGVSGFRGYVREHGMAKVSLTRGSAPLNVLLI
jgi:hypothetical protein